MSQTLRVTASDLTVLEELSAGAVIRLDANGSLRLNGRRLHPTTWSALLSAGLIARINKELPIGLQGNGYALTDTGRRCLKAAGGSQ
jgi:hypothetical protein